MRTPWTVLAALFLGLASGLVPAAEEAPLPKLVFTHAMGMMPAVTWYAANGMFPLTDYARSKPPNDFARPYGGQQRIAGLGFYYAFLRQDSSYNFNEPYQLWWERKQTSQHPDFVPYDLAQLENRYRWDLRMAEEGGLDGFGLCLSGNEASAPHAAAWFDTLEDMLRANPRTHLRLTIAICGDDLPNAERPDKYRWLIRLVRERGTSPAWLRHQGRIVFMGYHNHITWDSRQSLDPPYIRETIARHRALFAAMGIEPVFIYDGPEYVPGQISQRHLPAKPELLAPLVETVCERFAGYSCWGGVIPDEIYPINYRIIAETVHKHGKAWMMPIVNLHSGIGQFYKSKPGVERLLETWDFAAQTEARCVQLVTWNDTAEATGFQPSLSWNYALWGLNARFVHRFKYGDFPAETEDSVFLFYRKYHADADPTLYPRATVERDVNKWGETDDLLHVIVFAVAAGTLEVSGTGEGRSRRPLRRGFNEFKLTTAVNQELAARIFRDGRLAHELVSPERVTDRPYREDLIPWGWSSACRRLYDRDFGKSFRPVSYYSQRDGDGIPDWFRLHYFGSTEAKPGLSLAGDDPDGDGVDNRHEYLGGDDPRTPNAVYSPGFRWDELTAALSPITDGRRGADRINLNPYPDKLGKLVHAFLYTDSPAPDAPWRYLMKWSNAVPGVPTGWGLRTGGGPGCYLDGEGTVGMRLPPGQGCRYRFLAPVAGTLRVTAEFAVRQGADVEFQVRHGAALLFSAKGSPGHAAPFATEIHVAPGDRLDFSARGGEDGTARVTVKPVLEFLRGD